MLTRELGFKRVVTASSTGAGIGLLSRLYNSLKLVILEDSDEIENREYFLNFIENAPQLDFPAVILVGDRKPKNLSPRVDMYLKRPFTVKYLKAAIQEAMQRRAQNRSMIVVASQDQSWNLEGYDAGVKFVDSPEKLCEILDKKPRNIGSVLLDLENPIGIRPEKLNAFLRTSYGCETFCVGIGANAKQFHEFRTILDRTKHMPVREAEKKLLITQLKNELRKLPETKHLISLMKARLQKDSFEDAQDTAKQILKMSPENTEALCLTGSCFYMAGKFDVAEEYYLKAVASNQCDPRGYVFLLDLYKRLNKNRALAELHEAAVQFCPDLPEFKKRSTSRLHEQK